MNDTVAAPQNPTVRRRGPNKNPTKSTVVHSGKRTLTKLGRELKTKSQKLSRRERKMKSMMNKENELKDTIKNLQSMVKAVVPLDVSVDQACKVVRTKVLTPLNLTIAQLEQSKGGLNFTSMENMRAVQDSPRLYDKKFMPARTTVQRTHQRIAEAGKTITQPKFSKRGDMVTLNTVSVVEEIINASAWPGCDKNDHGFYPVETLKPLELDATADGARLTPTQGMIIQGIKVVSPELVLKLAGTSSGSQRSPQTSVSVSTAEEAMGSILSNVSYNKGNTVHRINSVSVGDISSGQLVLFSLSGARLKKLVRRSSELIHSLWPQDFALPILSTPVAGEQINSTKEADAVEEEEVGEDEKEIAAQLANTTINHGSTRLVELRRMLQTNNGEEEDELNQIVNIEEVPDATSSSASSNAVLAQRWANLFEMHAAVFADITMPTKRTDAEIDQLQAKIDQYGLEYIGMFGGYAITNYIHDLLAGHVTSFMRRFGTLYRHSNVGLEATVGATTSYYHRGTQHGGHAGRKGTYSTVKAMSSHMTKKFMITCGKLTGNLSNYMAEKEELGKKIIKRKTNLHDDEQEMDIIRNSDSEDTEMDYD